MQTFNEKIEAFRARVEADQLAFYTEEYPRIVAEGWRESNWGVSVKPGKKYTKVDVGTSGRYMVENDTGEIYGIKGYGVIHRGHHFGNLDTIAEWNWGGYVATRKAVAA